MGNECHEHLQASRFSVAFFLDYAAVPLFIIYLLYQPDFAAAPLFHTEVGQYLGPLEGILYFKQVPYRDMFVLYGPLSVYLPALVMLVFGPSLWTLRAYFYFSSILSAVFCYFLARTLLRTRLCVLLVTGLCLAASYDKFWFSSWGGLRNGIGLLIIFLLCRAARTAFSGALLLAAGTATAAALLLSTELGLAVLAADLVFLFMLEPGPRLRAGVMFFGVGFGALAVPCIIYLSAQDALLPYLKTAFVDIPCNHFSRFGQLEWRETLAFSAGVGRRLEWLAAAAAQLAPLALSLLLCGWFVACGLIKRNRTPRNAVLAALATYGMLISAAAFRVSAGPQRDIAMLPLILLAAAVLEPIASTACKTGPAAGPRMTRRASPRQYALLGCALLFLAAQVTAIDAGIFRSIPQQIAHLLLKSPVQSLSPYTIVETERGGGALLPASQAAEVAEVTAYLRSRTRPGEPIFIFPDMGAYYLLADRPSVGRFPVAVAAYLTDEYRREIALDLVRAAPRYILYGTQNSLLASSIDRRDEELLPETVAYIRAHYRLEKEIGSVQIMRAVTEE